MNSFANKDSLLFFSKEEIIQSRIEKIEITEITEIVESGIKKLK